MAGKPTTRKAAAKKPAASRRPAAKAKPAEQTEEAAPKLTPQQEAVAQAQEKVNTYNALQEAGLPIPAELRTEVEAAGSQSSTVQTQRYVRNLGHTLFRFKLNSHTAGQRGIVLQGRGNRGDLQPIGNEDLNDPNLHANLDMGLVEIITHGEAQDVVSKQTHNQQATHPALAALRNSQGNEYAADALKVDTVPFEQQGTVVAKLEDGQIAFDRSGIRDRIRGDAPGTPDYVTGAEPGSVRPANEDPSFLSDIKARQRGVNPAESLKVTVEAPVNTGTIFSDGFKQDK